jgi:hypothetical protein
LIPLVTIRIMRSVGQEKLRLENDLGWVSRPTQTITFDT